MSPHDTQLLQAKILIVDDQADHVHLLERLLRETGYVSLHSTLDPREVCALHQAHAFDLILLDLQMPGMDGFAVMAALHAATAAAAPNGTVANEIAELTLPVIALTAQPGHKLRALQSGARDFIAKPFDVVEVKLRIHHMLEARLLHQQLAAYSKDLERKVAERTAQLQESEARYRSLTELAVDWYWEQNDAGELTNAVGPVAALLGLGDDASLNEAAAKGGAGAGADVGADVGADAVWDVAERQLLRQYVAARQPFLDFLLHRQRADGSRQQFRISGEPIFDRSCRFTGYRGLGVEVLPTGH